MLLTSQLFNNQRKFLHKSRHTHPLLYNYFSCGTLHYLTHCLYSPHILPTLTMNPLMFSSSPAPQNFNLYPHPRSPILFFPCPTPYSFKKFSSGYFKPQPFFPFPNYFFFSPPPPPPPPPFPIFSLYELS